jgi:hypothetical protein
MTAQSTADMEKALAKDRQVDKAETFKKQFDRLRRRAPIGPGSADNEVGPFVWEYLYLSSLSIILNAGLIILFKTPPMTLGNAATPSSNVFAGSSVPPSFLTTGPHLPGSSPFQFGGSIVVDGCNTTEGDILVSSFIISFFVFAISILFRLHSRCHR